MKKLFSIKWELIIAIVLGFLAIIGFSILTDDILGCIMEIILVFAFTSWIIIYSQIKEFRLTVKSLW